MERYGILIQAYHYNDGANCLSVNEYRNKR